MLLVLHYFSLRAILAIIVLVLVGCKAISRPLEDAALLRFQPDGIAQPLNSYHIKYRYTSTTSLSSTVTSSETMAIDFTWKRTNSDAGFAMVSDFTVVAAPGGTISAVEYVIDDTIYKWLGGDPLLGLWNMGKWSRQTAIDAQPAMPLGRIFDFADPQTPWNLPIKKMIADGELIGRNSINGIMASHYCAADHKSELWLAEDGGFVVKYLVLTDSKFGGSSTHILRSFELYNVNQLIQIKPPVHAQWLVEAIAQGQIHFPGCEPCIFPVPPQTEGIGRGSMTNGRDLNLSTSLSMSQTHAYLAQELPKLGWEISNAEQDAATFEVFDGANHFVITITADGSISYMPKDLTHFPIVWEEK